MYKGYREDGLQSNYRRQMADQTIDITLTPRQCEAFAHLTSPADLALTFGGAKGGGKSFLGCVWVLVWARRLIELWDLKESIHPLAIGFMGRKHATDFDKTTLETWKKTIPYECYEIHKQEKSIEIDKKVKIFFGGLSDQESINKFNSAELAFIFIDQAEETKREDIDVISASLRLTHNGIKPAYKTLYTANPAQCWLKDEFILAPSEKKIFVQSLPTDNPHLPEGYTQTLRDAFKYDPQKLTAYLEGNWDDIGSIDDLIAISEIKRCIGIPVIRFYDHRVVSCDVARFGDDQTVIKTWENEKCTHTEIIGKSDLMAVVGRLMYWEEIMGGQVLFVIDDTGLGGGVTDRLSEMEKSVLPINFAQKPIEPLKFKNKRSEMYSNAAKYIIDTNVCMNETDVRLHGELCATKYKILSDGRRQIEPKADTKKRLGHSPDLADAFVLGIEGLAWLNTEAGMEQHIQKLKPTIQQQPDWVATNREFLEDQQENAGLSNKGAYSE